MIQLNRMSIAISCALLTSFIPIANSYASDLNSVLKKSILVVYGPAGDGSGVVIGKKGNQYLLLTAKHVSGSNADESEVLLPSGNSEALKVVKQFPGVDVSIATFESNQTIIPLAINSFIAYPAPNTSENNKQLNLRSKINTVTTKGRVAGYSLPTDAIKVRVFRVIESEFVDLIEGNTDGYNLLYQASTIPGMSGGPVVGFRDCSNNGGFALGISPSSVFPSLIGIHGRSEGYLGQGRSGISLAVPINGQIIQYIKTNSAKYGVPDNEESVRELVDKNHCPVSKS